jgi:hypothetical protein
MITTSKLFATGNHSPTADYINTDIKYSFTDIITDGRGYQF